MQSDSDFFIVLKTLYGRRKLIIVNFIIVFVLSAVFSLMMPKTYRSRALIMPPAPQQDLGFLSALAGNIPFTRFNLGQGDYESMTFLAILNSRTVMENVINKFNLMEFYDSEKLEDAVKILRGNTGFDVEDEGTISIIVDVKTGWFPWGKENETVSQLVTDIANFFAEDLDSVNKRLKSEQARFQRIFIEKRYNENIQDLTEVEEEFKAFQEQHKMIALPEQMKAAIEAASTIQAQILASEVKLGVMEKTLSHQHPALERVKSEIAQLETQLKELESGSENEGFLPKFSEVPDLGIQLLRFERELEIQNTLFAFLTQQYEEAKIQEVKNTPTLQVLDRAVKPERKHKPKRALFVLFFSFLSVILTSFYIIFKPSLKNL